MNLIFKQSSRKLSPIIKNYCHQLAYCSDLKLNHYAWRIKTRKKKEYLFAFVFRYLNMLESIFSFIHSLRNFLPLALAKGEEIFSFLALAKQGEKRMNKETIAKQNDLFRETMICTNKHHVILTEGVAQSKNREEVITKIRNFNDFTENNNPYGENDFGKVTVNETNYYFKIDYFDQNFEYGADPYSSPVNRVMTIMRTDEY